jgi:tol-pal system protein YbgF
MVIAGKPSKMPTTMSRSAPLFVIAVACLLGADAAWAQDTPSDVVTRLGRLEETVRDLTGSVQELQYRNQQLEQQLQRLQGGAAPAGGMTPPGAMAPPGGMSPSGMSPSGSVAPPMAQRPSVSTSLPPPTATQYSSPGSYSPPPAQYSQPVSNPQYAPPPYGAPPAPIAAAEPSDTGHDAFNPALHPNAPGVPHALGTSTDATEPPPPLADRTAGAQPGAPLNLSNLSAPQDGAPLPPPPLANPSGIGAMQEAALPPNATPKDEYDLAYGYVLQKNYGFAAQAFRDFLHKYPNERLTPDAQYWLGESLFQDQKYHDAAEAFLAVSTKYGTSGRAPDALLGLGQSLAALGEKEAACASLGEVLRKYPHASISVKQNVDREQKRVHC